MLFIIFPLEEPFDAPANLVREISSTSPDSAFPEDSELVSPKATEKSFLNPAILDFQLCLFFSPARLSRGTTGSSVAALKLSTFAGARSRLCTLRLQDKDVFGVSFRAFVMSSWGLVLVAYLGESELDV